MDKFRTWLVLQDVLAGRNIPINLLHEAIDLPTARNSIVLDKATSNLSSSSPLQESTEIIIERLQRILKEPQMNSAIQTATNGKTITYNDLILATREMNYHGYISVINQLSEIQSNIERTFRLQKVIDTHHDKTLVKTLKQVAEDLQDGSVQLYDTTTEPS